ncbi:pth [Wigglesworthia glossinidia endosymbiont of Glossina brevipalpis]|uniref:Peptidyl-tRNA hydrolase n=1 Tax=Wigglesworthia glossinidia brevipalpis TaxID=36870 RepID=PTH_WIGBR|nr:RecName: Full=Peptidyl-tRNA hydrolase; Short=PTH [Wigglesworthia glossinidia endosymbiont of Glossina brevipalpis]BAC24496.1 pth [Wigglesworthia glossinidia endosymbiont of Glossina brevipalpis]
MKLKLIVGLSNPINLYYNTRHNIGSWYIKFLAKKYKKNLIKNKKYCFYYIDVKIGDYYSKLVIPDTYMNVNGTIIYNITNFYKIYSNEMLIVHDDLDLDTGIARFKFNHKNSTHNGIKSIYKSFGAKCIFNTLRIGIGRPKLNKNINSYLLNNPSPKEEILIKKTITKCIKCTDVLIKKNKDHAMNILHKK